MSWIGWDYWEAPDGYVDVQSVWPAWEAEGSLQIFWIGTTMDSRLYRVFSQRATVDSSGHVTPTGSVTLIQELDDRSNWHIYSVQPLSNGGYAVWAHWEEIHSS